MARPWSSAATSMPVEAFRLSSSAGVAPAIWCSTAGTPPVPEPLSTTVSLSILTPSTVLSTSRMMSGSICRRKRRSASGPASCHSVSFCRRISTSALPCSYTRAASPLARSSDATRSASAFTTMSARCRFSARAICCSASACSASACASCAATDARASADSDWAESCALVMRTSFSASAMALLARACAVRACSIRSASTTSAAAMTCAVCCRPMALR